MQEASNSNYVEGIFVRELKNRFLCEVSISGSKLICYVPSSCRLSNFMQLEGKRVLLTITRSTRARTKYALFAVYYRRGYIFLNSSVANRAVEASLSGRRFSFLKKRETILREHTVYNYKTDFYIADTDTIVEIKSIISTQKRVAFPSVHSERAIKQLKHLQLLLSQGHKVCLLIVSLSPTVKEIFIDDQGEFCKEFYKCIQLGMHISAYTCRIKQGIPVISNVLPLCY